ncbi:MAG: CsgG/HfaB family protein [Elusimicrobia bacterium]|nr:CsgG/HfaB family protein [Elusimicrobiota bacterium]
MKYSKILPVFLLLLALMLALHADELKPKLEKISQKLADTASAKGLSDVTLAVFPLQSDEKLEKKKVNFATGEILTYYLLKTGTFKMVERTQIETVMKEQNLGLSGAVDSKTAAGIGQILGAKLLVMGNVIKLGSSYQITVKLVDAVTSEMISSEITEVPVETFDKEAAPYLILVPEYQAIGIFLGGVYGMTPTVKTGPQTYDFLTLTPINPDKSQGNLNFGIRYWVKPKYMFQMDYTFIRLGSNNGTSLITEKDYMGAPFSTSAHYTGFLIRGSISRTGKLSMVFNSNVGLGLGNYSVYSQAEFKNATETSYYAGGHHYYISQTSDSTNFFTPFLRAGVEWKPQARFGWNLSANWNILKKTYKQQINVMEEGSTNTIRHLMTLWQSKFPSLYFDTSIALYF